MTKSFQLSSTYRWVAFGGLTLLLMIVLTAISADKTSAAEPNSGSRKIIVFKAGVSDEAKDQAVHKAKGLRIKSMRKNNLLVAQLNAQGEKELLKNNNVAFVEDDVVVEAVDVKGLKTQAGNTSTQILPWGVDRVDADLVWPSGNTGTGIKVGIIDTGISLSHPDLASNIKGGVSEVGYTTSPNDDNGHGSHVAGIVGAVNNTTGVIGVANKADLYAIKVLDRNGSGFLSDVIDGIDWARLNGMKVINLSLGCDCPSVAMHDAVIRAYNAGVVIVAAAGNSGGSVIYPAAYPEVIAVAATDSTNTAPSWSSRGTEVDIAAPGVNIYSTYKGTRYTTLSGTSMASPHIAGSVALVLGSAISSTYDLDLDGIWDPQEVQNKLQATATDLGAAGKDDVYGYGLVNVFAATR